MRCRSFNSAVLATGAALASMSGPASAQTATPVAATEVASAQADAGAAALNAAPPDIIVTAQRRSERLRDVPISITAISGDTLAKAGISNILDIARVTPGLELPLYGGFVQPAIRGISSAGAGLGDSSNVAVYVDGVYQSSESGQLQDLPDVRQVEVLKGPQGALYGQNAAGGAIILTTIAPSFTTAGKLSASYGNYDDKAARGYVTGPLSDTVAAEIAGSWEDRDGFRHNVVTGGRDRGLRSVLVRGKLLYKPSDAVSFTLGGGYSRRADGGVFAGQPLGGDSIGYGLASLYGLAIPKAANPRQFAESIDPDLRLRTYGINLRGEFKLDIGTISTVTSYNNVGVHSFQDPDFSAVNVGDADLKIAHRDFIQEVNFRSRPIGRLTLAAGLFYLDNLERYDPQVFNVDAVDPLTGPTVAPARPTVVAIAGTRSRQAKHSYAAYIEADYDLADALTLSVGGRYSYERQRSYNGPPAGPIAADTRNPFVFKKFTPRATLRYRLDDTSNVYASYSRGFKSGFTNTLDFSNPPVKPEVVTAYEVGYKGRVSRILSINLAAFHYDYKDLQVFLYTAPTGYYQNAASARINGAEFETTLSLGHLTISGGGAFLDARYRHFGDRCPAGQTPPCAGDYRPNPIGLGNDQVSVDASGNRLKRAPKFTGTASADYSIDSAAGRFGAYVTGNYDSGFFYDAIERVRQHRYATLSAELSYAPAAIKGMRFILWGKNLTDHDYVSMALISQLADGVSYADPRTFGGRIEFAF